jgi:hypothetical protein
LYAILQCSGADVIKHILNNDLVKFTNCPPERCAVKYWSITIIFYVMENKIFFENKSSYGWLGRMKDFDNEFCFFFLVCLNLLDVYLYNVFELHNIFKFTG